MTTLHPWINFNGNAEEAFTLYKSVFGGEFINTTRFKDLASPESPVAEADAEKIMRITLSVDGENFLTGNDVPQFMGTVNEMENRSKIHIAPETREEAERIFNGLSAGGETEVQGDAVSDAYFAMFRDKFGIEWIIEWNAAS